MREKSGGDPPITPAMEDYLKAIYRLQGAEEQVTNQQLVDELGFTGASVTNMLKRLHDIHMLVMEPYKGVRLTPAGTAVALEVIRHHRLLELYLASTLGMDLDTVHAEADRLEHHVSEELEERIAAALGHPDFDPHGDPIPSPTLELPEIEDESLLDRIGDEELTVTRVSDRDASIVRTLVASGIVPGTKLCGVSRVPESGGLVVQICDGANVALNLMQAQAVRVN